MNKPDRPLIESYWVEEERFLAGEYPANQAPWIRDGDLARLLKAGFDTFIDLTGPHEFPPYESILSQTAAELSLTASYLRFPIEDFGLPSWEQMKKILDAIDKALVSGHKVYLHCWGGIGRTGTTVGCYLVRHGMTGQQALDQLQQWWSHVPKSSHHPRSPETEAQHDFIRSWHELA